MSKLWSIPVISAYLYCLTVLTQYGYSSYYNIPSSLIESSIKENIIFFFQIFQAILAIAGLLKWWMWLLILLSGLIIYNFFFSHFLRRKIFYLLEIIFFLLLLPGFYYFGGKIAQGTIDYYVPSSDCTSLNDNTSYVIPGFFKEFAILIPITEEKAMKGGMLIKDLSDFGCKIEKSKIGPIN